jgi:NAD(P)-dependent dehydrogenase (short-subunit alcohol dehydrogenase family)
MSNTHNPFSLENKVILVTGASSGIGKAVAVECSKAGAKVIINGRNTKRLKETNDLLSGEGHLILKGDLTDKNEVQSMIESLPALNGVVHCAGIMKTILFQFTSNDQVDEIMKTNFLAPVMLTHDLIEARKIGKNSSLVFISSIAGTLCSGIGISIYSASKGAINGIVKGMALDLAAKSIRVNSIIPGMIETPLFNETLISQQQLEDDKKRYPLKRYGRPEDVAYGAIYLLSDASSWSTGTNLLIDGGFTLL